MMKSKNRILGIVAIIVVIAIVVVVIRYNFSNGTTSNELDARCKLEPETGPCRAVFARYYFDQQEGICKEFIWGGCRGVVPFETLEQCQEICENSSLKTDEPESYISCGCGCCAFDEPLEEITGEECLYKSKGESIQDKIDQDKQLSPDFCATAGCSFPIKYVYCD